MATKVAASLKTVLIVGDFAALNGGQAKVAVDSARLLAGAGLDVVFFAASGPVTPALSHPRITVHTLDQHTILDDPNRLRAMRRGIWNGPAARELRRLAAQFDPVTTILHCHGFAKALSPSIGPVLADGPLRSVFTMHEYFLACPNGGFFDYQKNEICTRTAMGLSCLTTNCDARRGVHKAWRVVRQAALLGPGRLPRGLQDVIYISQTQRQAMAGYFGAKTRLHHVSNPVEAGGGPVDARSNDTFVFVGRLAPEKGALQFAQAAQAAGVKALFVGDGPERAAIEAANPDAEITGWVTPDQVQTHLSRARALVFPSLWYEGQPLVPIEALLRGIPVICGGWSAAHEVVRHGENGIIYGSPTVSALAGALGDIDKVGAFDSRALAAAVAPRRHLDTLITLYQGVLDRPSPSQPERSSP